GQEAEALAGLDRRAGEHDSVDLAARQRRHGHRHRQEGLAGAGRADADRDRLAANGVDVALLVHRLGRHAQAAVAPDHVLEDAARALVPVERTRDRLDRAGRDLVALPDEVGHLTHDGPGHRHRVVVAVQRQHVPPEEDLAVEVLLERLHDRVAQARKLGGDLVRELDMYPQGVSISFTAALTRLPSARPFTCGITRPMTLPISCGDDAPDSATALPTISLSSWSDSCSGRYEEITSAS